MSTHVVTPGIALKRRARRQPVIVLWDTARCLFGRRPSLFVGLGMSAYAARRTCESVVECVCVSQVSEMPEPVVFCDAHMRPKYASSECGKKSNVVVG